LLMYLVLRRQLLLQKSKMQLSKNQPAGVEFLNRNFQKTLLNEKRAQRRWRLIIGCPDASSVVKRRPLSPAVNNSAHALFVPLKMLHDCGNRVDGWGLRRPANRPLLSSP
jgi:hypothetical protein